MKLNIREDLYGVMVVTVDGNVMQEFVSVFRTRLDDLLSNGKCRIVLDLRDTTYMSSMCLAIMIDAKNRSSAAGGDVKIACAGKLVTNLLEITNLNRKINVFETVEEAVAAYNPERF